MLSQLSGQEKPDSSLDLPGGDGGPLVVVSQFGSLTSNTPEDVIDKRVHDAHGLAGNTSVGVNLLQHLVDVDSVGFFPFLVPLLAVTLGDAFLGFASFLSGLSGSLRRHGEILSLDV